MNGKTLNSLPIHLGLGATAEVCPSFNGEMAWYETYAKQHEKDGVEGRLVSIHTFEKPWDMWEMHPHGSEVVLCTAGAITLYQENVDGEIATIALEPGQYAINQAGVWHTADVQKSATAVFITAGLGTQHRPRL
jgi:hypothetical protein